MEKIILNHHAASILPFHIDEAGTLHIVLEQKDPNYKKPFFDNGFNFLGGNWQKGVFSEESPEKTLEREVREEFWQAYEAPESLKEILGEPFLEHEPQVYAQYDRASVERLKKMSDMLLEGVTHAGDYIMRVEKPIIDITFGLTVFTKRLSEEELLDIKMIARYFNGKLTTDNLKWGGKVAVMNLDEINRLNSKFCWGYDHVLNDVLERRISPAQEQRVIRTLGLVSLERLDCPAETERTDAGNSTYKGFESAGIEYVSK